MISAEKPCGHCTLTKPAAEFYVENRSGTHRLTSWCRSCTQAANRARTWDPETGTFVKRPTRQSPPGMKYCGACKQDKASGRFFRKRDSKDGLQSYCIDCRNKAARAPTGRKQSRTAQQRFSRSAKGRAAQRMRQSTPEYKLVHRLRERQRKILKRGKSAKLMSTMEALDCTAKELVQHLERQFTDGMTWENMGTAWHVDHVLEIARFDLADPKQYGCAFHYSNLQPLSIENHRTKTAEFLSYWHSGQRRSGPQPLLASVAGPQTSTGAPC